MLEEPVQVNEEIMRNCAEKGQFSALAFELYKEAGVVLSVCAHSFVADEENGVLSRNQAICAGLLVRMTKFMIAIAQLAAGGDRGEVVHALNRSLMESAIDLRFLVLKNEARFYDQFVNYSLGPERELYDIIQRNIAARADNEVLPTEKRMLKSIERVCQLSGLCIEEVSTRYQTWGGGVRERLKALGDEGLYASQRIGSHAVHGTWVDLLLQHLKEKNHGFVPDPTWSPVDARLLLPPAVLVLEAARAYLIEFVGGFPEARPLYARIDDLTERIRTVDAAHELWLSQQEHERKAS